MALFSSNSASALTPLAPPEMTDSLLNVIFTALVHAVAFYFYFKALYTDPGYVQKSANDAAVYTHLYSRRVRVDGLGFGFWCMVRIRV